MNEKTSNFGNADVSIIGGFLLNRVSQFLKKSWFFPLFVYDICRTGEKTMFGMMALSSASNLCIT